jgi:hypothetical protein
MIQRFLIGLLLACFLFFGSSSIFFAEALDPATASCTSQGDGKTFLIPFGSDCVDYLPAIGNPATSTVATGAHAAIGFKAIVERVLLFVRLVLGSFALFYLFVAGYQLVTAGSGISEVIAKQKTAIMYIVIGLILVTLSQEIVDWFYPTESQRLDFVNDPQSAGLRIARDITDIVNYFLSFVGAGAILVLVISSIRLIINPGSEDEVGKQKKVVVYTATGIIMIALSETLINQVVYPDGGYGGFDVAAGLRELTGISNFILGFLGVIVLVTLVIAGFMMIIYYGDDQKVTTAKSMIFNAILGSVVAYSAYTIVATIVNILA